MLIGLINGCCLVLGRQSHTPLGCLAVVIILDVVLFIHPRLRAIWALLFTVGPISKRRRGGDALAGPSRPYHVTRVFGAFASTLAQFATLRLGEILSCAQDIAGRGLSVTDSPGSAQTPHCPSPDEQICARVRPCLRRLVCFSVWKPLPLSRSAAGPPLRDSFIITPRNQQVHRRNELSKAIALRRGGEPRGMSIYRQLRQQSVAGRKGATQKQEEEARWPGGGEAGADPDLPLLAHRRVQDSRYYGSLLHRRAREAMARHDAVQQLRPYVSEPISREMRGLT